MDMGQSGVGPPSVLICRSVAGGRGGDPRLCSANKTKNGTCPLCGRIMTPIDRAY